MVPSTTAPRHRPLLVLLSENPDPASAVAPGCFKQNQQLAVMFQ
jgi:hypothetical protein